MKLDDLDIVIIGYIYKNENVTTSDIAKAILDSEDRNELKKNDNIIRNRLKKLIDKDVVLLSQSKPTYYNINKSKVMVGDSEIKVTNNGKSFKIDMGKCLIITYDNKYLSFLIEEDYPFG